MTSGTPHLEKNYNNTQVKKKSKLHKKEQFQYGESMLEQFHKDLYIVFN
jgi:hypothetical protein